MPMTAFHSLWEAMAAIKRRVAALELISDAREADEAMHRSHQCEPKPHVENGQPHQAAPDPFRGIFKRESTDAKA
jgi:hypothetical protein